MNDKKITKEKFMQELISKIVNNPPIHVKWLNTLSMMENVGARKIKKCEHPIFVSETILQHAAEEARHAFFLKKQIQRIIKNACPTYENQYLLAPLSSHAYLNKLDVEVCRYLKKTFQYKSEKLKYIAYLLVTYAIEVRADELYPAYQQVLDDTNSPITVRKIIAEEVGHLAEMHKQLAAFSENWQEMCAAVRVVEQDLFDVWVGELQTLEF